MMDRSDDTANPLRSTLAFLEREAARRAKGTHPGIMRLANDDIATLLELLMQTRKAKN